MGKRKKPKRVPKDLETLGKMLGGTEVKEERAGEYTNSPVLRRIFGRGWEAFEAGEERVSPYNHKTSGSRWRTFDHSWIQGYDEAAEHDW